MTDVERDLVALLERRAADVDTRIVPPPGLRKLARVRQAWTAATALGVVAIVAGAAVLATIGPPSRPARPARPSVSAVTAALSTAGVTVTYPKGWTALARTGVGATYVGDDETGVISVLPILQVTNFVPGPGAPLCPVSSGAAAAFPDDGVFLYVDQVLWTEQGAPLASDVDVLPLRVSATADDPCRQGPNTFPRGRRVIEALLVTGSKATTADRVALLKAYRNLEVDPGYVFPNTLSTSVIPVGPELTALQGRFRGSPWTSVVQATVDSFCIEVTYQGAVGAPPGGAGSSLAPLGGMCLDEIPMPDALQTYRKRFRRGDGAVVTFVVGVAPANAESVVVAIPGRPAATSVVGGIPAGALPEGEQASLFVVPIAGEVETARVSALDGAANLVGRTDLVCRPTTSCD